MHSQISSTANFPSESDAAPRNFLRALYRHRRKSLGVFLAVLLVTCVVASTWPAKFASDAKLFVRLGRESVGLDPTATTGQTISLSETRETEINSILDILNCRAMHERVLDSIPAETIVGQDYGERTREKALDRLAKSLTASASKRSNVITIHAEAGSPELAQQLAGALLQAYLDKHLNMNRTAGSHEFFFEQSRRAEDDVQSANEQLRDAKNQAGLVSVEGQRQILQSQATQVHGQILSVESALAAARTKVSAMREMIAQLPERVSDDEVSGLPNVAGDGMKQKLYELQIREQELAANVKVDHPQLVRVRAQIRESRKYLDAEPLERTQKTGRINRLRENLQLAEQSEAASVSAFEQQVLTLRNQLEKILADSRRLNEDELGIVRLQRAAELADSRVRAYGEKLEQARINRALDTERISNVNVVQEPTKVLKPASPQRALLAAAGLLLGGFLSIAVALAAEYLDQTMNSADEIEQLLNLPVVATLPRVAAAEALLN